MFAKSCQVADIFFPLCFSVDAKNLVIMIKYLKCSINVETGSSETFKNWNLRAEREAIPGSGS